MTFWMFIMYPIIFEMIYASLSCFTSGKAVNKNNNIEAFDAT